MKGQLPVEAIISASVFLFPEIAIAKFSMSYLSSIWILGMKLSIKIKDMEQSAYRPHRFA